MNYLLKPKPKKDPNLRKGLWFLFIFALIVGVFALMGSNATYQAIGPIARPFWIIEEKLTSWAGNMLALLQTKSSLVKENTSLKERINQNAALYAENDALRSENSILKGLAEEGSGESARVLTSPAQSFFDILSVELQPDSSVRTNAIVYVSGGTAIGTVIGVQGRLAKVQLFSSSGVTTAGTLVKDGTSLELLGQGGGSMLAVVPRAVFIAKGDTVELAAFQSAVVGTVEAVEQGRSDSFQNVYIAFPFNIFDLTWVQIRNVQ